MKTSSFVLMVVLLSALGLTGCVTTDGGGYSNQQNSNAFYNYSDGLQRRQQLINASHAERDAARASGRTWTRQDEQRRHNELNSALQQNALDTMRQMQGR